MADIATLQVPQIARRPLHEEAADRLRELIVQGRLAPGTRLNERLLCVQFGVSRTPLREAIKLLAAEGLVELLPNRGAIVAKVEAARVAETLAVMGVLEALAGELACRNATDAHLGEIRALHYEMLAMHARGDLAGYFKFNQAIHLKLVKYSGNAVLYQTLPPAERERAAGALHGKPHQEALGRSDARARRDTGCTGRARQRAPQGTAFRPSHTQARQRDRRPVIRTAAA